MTIGEEDQWPSWGGGWGDGWVHVKTLVPLPPEKEPLSLALSIKLAKGGEVAHGRGVGGVYIMQGKGRLCAREGVHVHVKACTQHYRRCIAGLKFASVLGSRHVYFQRWEWEARTGGLLESSALSNPRHTHTHACV